MHPSQATAAFHRLQEVPFITAYSNYITEVQLQKTS